MAFASAITKKTVLGDMRVHMGTFTLTAATTGGDIVTGLNTVETVQLQLTGGVVSANGAVVDETLPLASGSVTIETDALSVGVWVAMGH